MALLEVTFAAADVVGSCGEVRGQDGVHQRRESDTFVNLTADGRRWRLGGGNIIQCYKFTDS
jgi:hypothetical protein